MPARSHAVIRFNFVLKPISRHSYLQRKKLYYTQKRVVLLHEWSVLHIICGRGKILPSKLGKTQRQKNCGGFFLLDAPLLRMFGRRPPTRFRVSRTFTDTADLQLLVYAPLAPPSNYLSLSIIIVGLGEMSAPGTSQTVPSCSELGRNRVAAFPPILSFSRDCESRSVCRRVAGDKSSLTKLICWLT